MYMYMCICIFLTSCDSDNYHEDSGIKSQVGHCDAQHCLLCARTDALSVGQSTGSAGRCQGAPSDSGQIVGTEVHLYTQVTHTHCFVYIYKYVYMYICIQYIYIYICIYIYIYIHTYYNDMQNMCIVCVAGPSKIRELSLCSPPAR